MDENVKKEFTTLEDSFQRWADQAWADWCWDFKMKHGLTDAQMEELGGVV